MLLSLSIISPFCLLLSQLRLWNKKELVFIHSNMTFYRKNGK